MEINIIMKATITTITNLGEAFNIVANYQKEDDVTLTIHKKDIHFLNNKKKTRGILTGDYIQIAYIQDTTKKQTYLENRPALFFKLGEDDPYADCRLSKDETHLPTNYSLHKN